MKRIDTEIERVFQRLNYYLLGNTFLVVAFSAVAVEALDGTLTDLVVTLTWSIVAAGAVVSAMFWAINSWNCEVVYRYRQWLDGKTGKVKPDEEVIQWLSGSRAIASLGKAHTAMQSGFKKCVNDGKYSVGEMLKDLFNPVKPAWFARFIPFVLLVLWLVLAAACLAFGLIPSGSRAIGFVVMATLLILVGPIVGCWIANKRVKSEDDSGHAIDSNCQLRRDGSEEALLAKDLAIAVLNRVRTSDSNDRQDLLQEAMMSVTVYRTILAEVQQQRKQSAHVGKASESAL
jgi:hypothetical protein